MSGRPGKSGRHKPAVFAAESTKKDASRGNPEAPRPKRGLAGDDCPDWFDADHRVEWVKVMGAAPRGLLKVTDLAVTIEYCVQTVAYRKVTKDLIREGPTVNDRGTTRSNPRFRAQKQISERLMYVCRELGFTPSARQHVKIPIHEQMATPGVEAANDFEGL